MEGARESAAPAAVVSDASAGAPRRSRRLAIDLMLLATVGVLLIAALAAGASALYREFYSPTAFVERYLGLLAAGRAADALAMPGVAIDSSELEAAGLDPTASDALLRASALRSLTDVRVITERQGAEATSVTVEYTAGGYPGTTAFAVEQAGFIGAAPAWRFARSPLTMIELGVTGSMSFTVNGFELDKRQVAPEGVEADPASPVSLLVFSPGAYSISVDTALAKASGVAVLADVPLKNVPVQVEAEPTEQFVSVVQERVTEFLDACAAQQVLQPTGCPFGFFVQNRVEKLPVWTIVETPPLTLVPAGADWGIAPTQGTAHISVSIRSLFDGSVRQVEEDVVFDLAGTVIIQPDGSASITVTGAP